MPNFIATLLRKKYRVEFPTLIVVDGVRALGSCDPPEDKRKAILIDSSLRGQKRLEILIHEMLHACDWHKDESWIEEVSHDIARVLWRLG